MKPLYGSGFPNHAVLRWSPNGWGRSTLPAFQLSYVVLYAKNWECWLNKAGQSLNS